MARVDFVALQQRLVQQQPKPATPVPDEPPSWTARLATASAATPVGTLRATTTMRAALPLRSTNTRAERADVRARVDALRAQIDELSAALVVAHAEAKRALSQEQARGDRLSDRVDAVQRDLDAARADVLVAERRADAADTDRRVAQARLEHAETERDQAEAGREAERVRADAQRERIEALQAQLDQATRAPRGRGAAAG
jgi:chromosome segregation ATPase